MRTFLETSSIKYSGEVSGIPFANFIQSEIYSISKYRTTKIQENQGPEHLRLPHLKSS